jgi:hypothetical protein
MVMAQEPEKLANDSGGPDFQGTGREHCRLNQITNSDTLFPNWRVAGGR